MAVDFLRSCYSTDCQWTEDGVTGTIVWYFCENGAAALPFPTVFNSKNWDERQVGWSGVGEVYLADRPYRDGSVVGDAPGTGPPCGTADQWLNGQPTVWPEVTPVNELGTPICCNPVPDCNHCPRGGTPPWIRLTATHSAGGGIATEGIWILDYIGHCTWRSKIPILWQGNFDLNPGWWEVAVVPGGVQAQIREIDQDLDSLYAGPMPWDCAAPWRGTWRSATIPPEPWLGQAFNVLVEPQFAEPPGRGTACPVLANTSPVYYLEFTATAPFGPATEFAFFPEAGFASVFQSDNCAWTGQVFVDRFNTLQIPIRQGAVPLEASVAADGTLTVIVRMSALGRIFADGVYTSQPGWDGVALVALLPQFFPPGTVYYGNVCRVHRPAAP